MENVETEFEAAKSALLEYQRLPKREQNWLKLATLKTEYKAALAKKEKASVDLGPEFPDDLEGSIEVSQVNYEGKAIGWRYHLRGPRREPYENGQNCGELRS